MDKCSRLPNDLKPAVLARISRRGATTVLLCCILVTPTLGAQLPEEERALTRYEFWLNHQLSESTQSLEAMVAEQGVQERLWKQNPADLNALEWSAYLASGISNARGRLGDTTGALQAARVSYTRYGTVAGEQPGEPQHRGQEAAMLAAASIHADRGDTTSALPLYRRAVEAEKAFLAANPEDHISAARVGYFYFEIAGSLRKSDPHGAVEAMRSSQSYRERYWRSGAPEAEADALCGRRNLMSALADLLHDAGMTSEAIQQLEAIEAVDWGEGIPATVEMARGNARFNFAVLLEEKGETTAAIQALTAAADHYASAPPVDVDSRPHRASVWERIADLEFGQYKYARALDASTSAVALRKQLLAEDPQSSEPRADLAYAHQRQGAAMYAAGRISEALDAARAARQAAPHVEQTASTRTEALRFIVFNHGALRDALLAAGNTTGALESARNTVRDAGELVREDSESDSSRLEMLTHQTGLASVLGQRGETTAALEIAEAAYAMAESRPRSGKDELTWMSETIYALTEIADGLSILNETTSALEKSRAAVKQAEELVRREPANPVYRGQLAYGLVSQGTILRRASMPEESLVASRRAVAILEALAAEGHAGWWNTDRLIWSLNEIGNSLQTTDSTAAHDSWTRALTLADSPPDRGLAGRRAAKAEALLHLGRVEEARPLVREYLDAGWRYHDFIELCRKHGLI